MSLRIEDGYNSDIIPRQNKLKKKKRFRRGSKQLITVIRKSSISKLVRTGGIKRINGQIYDDSVSVLKSYLSELTEKNNNLEEQLKQQHMTIETLNAESTDKEIQIGVLSAENHEYKQTIKQTNDKYEDVINELLETRDHLSHATQQIEQYEETIQLLNNEIIHKTDTIDLQNKDSNSDNYKLKFEEVQKTYDELSITCSKYTNDYKQLVNKQTKLEQNNKTLKNQLTEMTCNNVQLEKQINDFSVEIATQKETIKYLQNKRRSACSTPNHSPDKIKKKFFYSPLKHSDKYIVVQTYEDNEQYWNSIDIEQKDMKTIDKTKSEKSVDFKRDRSQSLVHGKIRMEMRHVKKDMKTIDNTKPEMSVDFKRDRSRSFVHGKIRMEMRPVKKSLFCTLQ